MVTPASPSSAAAKPTHSWEAYPILCSAVCGGQKESPHEVNDELVQHTPREVSQTGAWGPQVALLVHAGHITLPVPLRLPRQVYPVRPLGLSWPMVGQVPAHSYDTPPSGSGKPMSGRPADWHQAPLVSSAEETKQ